MQLLKTVRFDARKVWSNAHAVIYELVEIYSLDIYRLIFKQFDLNSIIFLTGHNDL